MNRARSSLAPLSFVTAVLGIIRKDLLLEWRGRARVNATLFFALVTLLLFSFAAGPAQAILAKNAAGYLWLAVLLASTLSLNEAFRVENENEAIEGLRLLPVDARAIFLGKAIANTLLLASLSLVLVPFVVALYSVSVAGAWSTLCGIFLLGCAAISAPGTLYAAIANQARARDVLLPLLLFPILVPALVGAVRATALVLEGDPMGEMPSWVALLAAFNLTYWALGVVLFGRVVEP
ncbi:MAG: heme exporter protein CcmB [Deltaproteobacteria bacterium]|nr:heme exporter protein CcmB [Deltaproteobacteria bacterium]